MDSIRIERLRSLSDTGDIQIKPITVLLGQNSSGKSTLLRVLPLLKQSVESRTTGPILWYGRLVDFGSFEDAHQNNSEKTIAFSFKFFIKPQDDARFFYYIESPYGFVADGSRLLNEPNVSLTLEVIENKKKETRASRLTLLFEDSKIQLVFSEDENVSSFYVNDLDILELGSKYISRKINNRSLLPLITEVEQKKDSDLEEIAIMYKFARPRFRSFSTLLSLLIKEIKNKVHPSTSRVSARKRVLFCAIEAVQ